MNDRTMRTTPKSPASHDGNAPTAWRGRARRTCDDEVIPLQERIDAIGDEADLEDVFNTERHLLYVGCTRARDHLLITGSDPSSEFLDDF